MSTETQGLPLWDVFLAGDSTLPKGIKKGVDENKKNPSNFRELLA